MKTKKRSKRSRQRGSHTHGHGAMKKSRGSGHRGGVGMSGSGKKGDQKKTKILNLKEPYFGRTAPLGKPIVKKLKVINLDKIQEKFPNTKEVNLRGYKILSQGDLKTKLTIKASAASKAAVDKVKKAGGDIILLSQKKEVEKPVEKSPKAPEPSVKKK